MHLHLKPVAMKDIDTFELVFSSREGASTYHRVQVTTDPENKAELACIHKLGFTLEGRVRQGQWREGAWHDQLLFSLLRNEWELASPHELCEGK